MGLTDILKEFGGKSLFDDRKAYYDLTEKKIGTPKDWVIDAFGITYTFAPLAFTFDYLLDGDLSNLLLVGITAVSKIAGPRACKEFIDLGFDETYLFRAQVAQLRHERNDLESYAAARRTFDTCKKDSKMLYNSGHYLAAVHRMLDFPGELRCELAHDNR